MKTTKEFSSTNLQHHSVSITAPPVLTSPDIRDAKDWLSLRSADLKQHGGYFRYKSLGKTLATLYPEYKKMCREAASHVAYNLKLGKVEELLKVPQEYLLSLRHISRMLRNFNSFLTLQLYSVARTVHVTSTRLFDPQMYVHTAVSNGSDIELLS